VNHTAFAPFRSAIKRYRLFTERTPAAVKLDRRNDDDDDGIVIAVVTRMLSFSVDARVRNRATFFWTKLRFLTERTASLNHEGRP